MNYWKNTREYIKLAQVARAASVEDWEVAHYFEKCSHIKISDKIKKEELIKQAGLLRWGIKLPFRAGAWTAKLPFRAGAWTARKSSNLVAEALAKDPVFYAPGFAFGGMSLHSGVKKIMDDPRKLF